MSRDIKIDQVADDCPLFSSQMAAPERAEKLTLIYSMPLWPLNLKCYAMLQRTDRRCRSGKNQG